MVFLKPECVSIILDCARVGLLSDATVCEHGVWLSVPVVRQFQFIVEFTTDDL